ncbi:MAG: GNAT family N-acetyltransferase [Methanobacteriota archaeon]|nr:MAG: GNAT family N-acetyltransferase [Euryarchaeota archaeon]
MVIIRFFEEKDADSVISVARKAWHHTYAHIFSKERIEEYIGKHYNSKTLIPGNSVRNAFWVAEETGKIIGFAQIGLLGEEMHLWRIYLDPSFIGKGIGSKLLKTVESFMKEQGIQKYRLEVHQKNKLGLSFYERKGFKVIETAGESCNSDCEIVMEKELN